MPIDTYDLFVFSDFMWELRPIILTFRIILSHSLLSWVQEFDSSYARITIRSTNCTNCVNWVRRVKVYFLLAILSKSSAWRRIYILKGCTFSVWVIDSYRTNMNIAIRRTRKFERCNRDIRVHESPFFFSWPLEICRISFVAPQRQLSQCRAFPSMLHS